MSEPEAPPPLGNPLLEEAAAWFARMRGPDAEASRAEFEAWLRRGALHRNAYNRAAEIFAMGKLLSEDGPHAPVSKDSPGRTGPRRPRLLAAAAATLVTLAVTAWLVLGNAAPGGPWPSRGQNAAAPALYAALLSPKGPTRLPDGSLVMLSQDALLEVLLGSSERRFRLVRGQARFDVFHEPRPFIVQAGGGEVTARGTVFEVDLSAERDVSVRLFEGMVDVALPAPGPGKRPPTRRLRPGDSLSFAAAGPGETILPADIERAQTSAASNASLVVSEYENVTVAQMIAFANLGSDRPIRLAAPAVADKRISGRFGLGDSVLLAERLAILFDLAIDRAPPDQIVLRPR